MSLSERSPGFVDTTSDTVSISDCLETLSPARRTDYKAVVIEGIAPSEQATKRGVLSSTVCENVSRAKEQVSAYLREQGVIPRTHSPGYDVEVHTVGGRESDGTPAAIGKWTFETSAVRNVVEDLLSGRVLNACAGRTHLRHGDGTIIRNDKNEDRDADFHYDVCEISPDAFGEPFDVVVFDPPFDQSNADKHYEGIHAGDISAARKNLAQLVRPGGLLIELGWNSHNIARASDAWEQTALHLFYRGPCLPDMFLTVSQKTQLGLGEHF